MTRESVGAIIALTILALTGIVVVDGALKLRDWPTAVKLNVGQNTSLACRSTLSHDVECQWVRNGQPVVIGKGTWISMYDWQGSPRFGDCSLRLIGTNLEHHSGTWQCTVSDLNTVGNTVSSSPVLVTLLVEPQQMNVEITGSGMWIGKLPIENGRVTIQEGTNITANCTVCCGAPNATISWKKVTSSRTISLISSRRNVRQANFTWLNQAATDLYITREDNRATLNCSAYHETFRGRKSKRIVLNVLYPPKNLPAQRNLTGYLYERVALDCPLRGNPTPTYSWYFQGENGSWIPVVALDGSYERDGTNLYLDNANSSQAGLYNCTAVSAIFSQRYHASGLLYLSLVEGGAFRSLKSKEAIILGVILGILLLGGIIAFFIWLKKRKTGSYTLSGRTYVSANDKDSAPEGPMDTGSGTGPDCDTQLNQMAWNAESSPKEPSLTELISKPAPSYPDTMF